MSRGDVARWWNVDYLAPMTGGGVSTTSSAGVESTLDRSSWSGTLLGPEGSRVKRPLDHPIHRTARRSRVQARQRRVRDCLLGWYRPYLENCIVDASIFVAILLYMNDKLLRAHGGCLGIKSR
jgi:hypothetical protein